MTEPRSLARHIRDCFENGGTLRTSAADAKLWLLAVHELVKRSALTEAAYAARQLSVAFSDSLYIRNIAMLLDRMPPAVADPAFAKFVNQWERSLQVVPRVGAKITLVVFGDRHGSLGMPLPIAHRWFGPLRVHVIYLRDSSENFFVNGVSTLAGDRAGTVHALASLMEMLGTTCAVCYGNSSGGTAALLYGLEMDAAAVLAFNAIIVPPAHSLDRKEGSAYTASITPDLPDLYRNAAKRPRTRLVYGASNVDDTCSAQAMAGIPGVTVQAVPDCSGHDAHITLIERGQFGPLLHAFIAEQAEGSECGAIG